jgi:hypothetical protein
LRGLSSIYQTDSMVDAATVAALAVESDVVDDIDGDYIEVDSRLP